MDLLGILRILHRRRVLKSHLSWSREELLRYQSNALARLRTHAYEHSAFFRKFHKGLEDAPLGSLPILTKSMLMERFSQVAINPELNYRSLEAHLRSRPKIQLYKSKYFVSSTSGTTGQKGIFPFDQNEWLWILASLSRAFEWAGVRADPLHRVRTALVTSKLAWHQSFQLGQSASNPWVPILRLDSLDPIEVTVTKLNTFQPQVLIAYAGMAAVLADEQRSGRLQISPHVILSVSEVLTHDMRKRIRKAWHFDPYDLYGATEAGTIAAECAQHRGLHLFEDLVITEVVDEHYQSVPLGSFGTKVLVTVLFSRTLPLIRYEMSDSLMLSKEACPCGIPFALVQTIQGRVEDIIYLPSANNGKTALHPNFFHRVLEDYPIRSWQIVQEPNRIKVRIVGNDSGWDKKGLLAKLERDIRAKGAQVPIIELESALVLSKTAVGKSKLIAALNPMN